MDVEYNNDYQPMFPHTSTSYTFIASPLTNIVHQSLSITCPSSCPSLTKLRRRISIHHPLNLPKKQPFKCCTTSDTDILVSESILETIVAGTRLENQSLSQVYSSKLHGFDNESFFETMFPLDGVPSLLLGRTIDGHIFGGYTAFGFAARDDYREATTDRAMFVFSIDSSQNVIEALRTDRVQYDFYDYAVRFGAALLTIPMNPNKHIMRANVGTSSCVLPNGRTSVFGEYTRATLDLVQVFAEKKYVDMAANDKQPQKGFFSRFFGGGQSTN